MRSLRTLSLGVSAALALAFGTAAHADPVITAITITGVDLGAVAPGSPDNYDFGDFGGGDGGSQPTHLTSFTVDTSGATQVGTNDGYSTLKAPGGTTAFLTGAAVIDSTDQSLVGTFHSLSATSFEVYLLTGNADNITDTTQFIALGVNGSLPVFRATDPNAYDENDFAVFTVTGALPTDTFQFYATSTGAGPALIGGITFAPLGASPVPEPSSLALFGTGVLGVAGAGRRKFFKG